MKNRYLIYFMLAGLILGCFCSAIISNVRGADTGAVQCDQTGDNYNEWTNPTFAYTQNDISARGQAGSAANNEQDYYGFDFGFINFDSVLGIQVSFDGYAASGLSRLYCKLSWDGGSSYTGIKITPYQSTTDNDIYVSAGGATDTWGRVWDDEDEFSESNFRLYVMVNSRALLEYVYVDHIYITVWYEGYPSDVTNLYIMSESCSTDVNISCYVPTQNFDQYNDYIMIRRDDKNFPSSTGDGDLVYNGTMNYSNPWLHYTDSDTNADTIYYYSLWSYNITYKLWSDSYTRDKVRTNCECDNTSLTKYQFTGNATGTHESEYDSDTGWKVWANYSSTYNFTFFLKNVTGFATATWSPVTQIWDIIVNYTGDMNSTNITIFDNTVDVTGNYEFHYDNYTGWFVYMNFTGDCATCNSTALTIHNNTVNVTGGYESHYDIYTGWDVYMNYTGVGGVCEGIYWFNYSDENVTINISFNKGTDTYVDDEYEINEDNWLWLSGFDLETGILGIVTVMVFFGFAINHAKDGKGENYIISAVLCIFATVMSLATGVHYLGFERNSIEWFAGITFFLFATFTSFLSLY
jgi:hypothetical protein